MSKRWRVAFRRLRRYAREPQGLAVGTILVLAGLPLARWLEKAFSSLTSGTISILAIVLSLGAWLLLVFFWDWLALAREGVLRRALLVGGPIQIERDGWNLAISQTASGITAAVDLVDKANGWPIDTRWELVNPFGEEKRVVIRAANPVNVMAQWPGFAQVTWPIDFWGEEIEPGPYSLRWVVEGTSVIEHTFQVKQEKVAA